MLTQRQAPTAPVEGHRALDPEFLTGDGGRADLSNVIDLPAAERAIAEFLRVLGRDEHHLLPFRGVAVVPVLSWRKSACACPCGESRAAEPQLAPLPSTVTSMCRDRFGTSSPADSVPPPAAGSPVPAHRTTRRPRNRPK